MTEKKRRLRRAEKNLGTLPGAGSTDDDLCHSCATDAGVEIKVEVVQHSTDDPVTKVCRRCRQSFEDPLIIRWVDA